MTTTPETQARLNRLESKTIELENVLKDIAKLGLEHQKAIEKITEAVKQLTIASEAITEELEHK